MTAHEVSRRTARSSVCALLTMLLLSACGGGGSGEAAAPPAAPPQLSVLAGAMGGAGNLDGAVNVARFDEPVGVAVDAAGNRYVADRGNHTIRRMTPDGSVSTLAGRAGEPGSADGVGAAARFRSPGALALDADGQTLWVADTGNRSIRGIRLATGEVNRLAGQPDSTAFAVDGPVGSARFVEPQALAVGPASLGSPIFVADTSAHAIRMISAGQVTTVAGVLMGANCGAVPQTPAAGDSRLCSPVALAFRPQDGKLYFLEAGRRVLRSLRHAAGPGLGSAGQNTIEFVAGSPQGLTGTTDGIGAAATFAEARGLLAGNDGELFVGQRAALRRVRLFGEANVVDTVAGSSTAKTGHDDGIGSAARFGSLAGLALDSDGRVLLADVQNHLVRSFDPATRAVTTAAGQRALAGSNDGAAAQARFGTPRGIAFENDDSVIVAEGAERIRRISIAQRQVSLAAALGIETPAAGIAALAPQGSGAVFTDTARHSIWTIRAQGVQLLAGAGMPDGDGFADGAGSAARFFNPVSVALDAQGNAWVADRGNGRIRRVSPAGQVTTLGGPVDIAVIEAPTGIAAGPAGDMYVIDASTKTLRRIVPGAQGELQVTTLATNLVSPSAVAVDAAGNVYVADDAEHTVRRYRPGDASGAVLLGTPGACGFVPGALPGVLCRPRGLAVHNGRLLVSMDHGVAMVEPLPR